MKVLGVHPDLFYVAFIGQSIVAASQVFILSLPAKLAAVWFGPNQVSSACSIGVFGNQVSVTTISFCDKGKVLRFQKSRTINCSVSVAGIHN